MPPRIATGSGRGPGLTGNVVRQRLQFQLRKSRILCVAAGQGIPLGGECLVERGPDLIQGASQIAASSCLGAQLSDLVSQPVEPATTVLPAAHQIAQGVAYGSRREHVLTDLVDGCARVERWPERVWPAAPWSVAETVMGLLGSGRRGDRARCCRKP